MAKKSDEKDVLIVRDEKTGEISVVADLNADGSPKRTPARLDNAKDFLLFDKHGDMLDNFFKNFFRQCKEPSRFGFYRIAADQVDSLLGSDEGPAAETLSEQGHPCPAQGGHIPLSDADGRRKNGKERRTK